MNAKLYSSAICLAFLLVACGSTSSPQSSTETLMPTPAYSTFVFDIIDEVTGEPVTANITLRREASDGTLLGEPQTFTGQHIEFDALVDPDVQVLILVEAEEYNDWEITMRVKKASTLKGPIRLKRVIPPTFF